MSVILVFATTKFSLFYLLQFALEKQSHVKLVTSEFTFLAGQILFWLSPCIWICPLHLAFLYWVIFVAILFKYCFPSSMVTYCFFFYIFLFSGVHPTQKEDPRSLLYSTSFCSGSLSCGSYMVETPVARPTNHSHLCNFGDHYITLHVI